MPFEDASDENLLKLIRSVAADLAAADTIDDALLLTISDKPGNDFSEINVIDENGIITCSTNPEYRGFDMSSGGQYSLLKTKSFGVVLMMEVGAMLVGKIVNLHGATEVKKGQEKGHFEFGGSTVILCFQRGVFRLDDRIWADSEAGIETPVRMGERIGISNIKYVGLAAYKECCGGKTPYVTLVDCGDALQGDVIGSISEGEYSVELMNHVGYDLAVLGTKSLTMAWNGFPNCLN